MNNPRKSLSKHHSRRRFLGDSVAALAAAATGGGAFASVQEKPKRVGLIGCGWYGKNDLFRLIQVAPVDVVSLCDVDRKMRVPSVGRRDFENLAHIGGKKSSQAEAGCGNGWPE